MGVLIMFLELSHVAISAPTTGYGNVRTDLNAILGWDAPLHIWAKLQSLNLSDSTIQHSSLSHFLERHHGTLRELSLSRIRMVTDVHYDSFEPWTVLVTALRHEWQLEKVDIKPACSDACARQVHRTLSSQIPVFSRTECSSNPVEIAQRTIKRYLSEEIPCGCTSCVKDGWSTELSPNSNSDADGDDDNIEAPPHYTPWVLQEDVELSDAGDDDGHLSDGDEDYDSPYGSDEGENFFS